MVIFLFVFILHLRHDGTELKNVNKLQKLRLLTFLLWRDLLAMLKTQDQWLCRNFKTFARNMAPQMAGMQVSLSKIQSRLTFNLFKYRNQIIFFIKFYRQFLIDMALLRKHSQHMLQYINLRLAGEDV